MVMSLNGSVVVLVNFLTTGIDLLNLIQQNSLKPITDLALSSLKNDSIYEVRNIQGFNESVMGIIIHVIEHFSYHTGQIAMIAKFLENKDLGFYGGLDLDITS